MRSGLVFSIGGSKHTKLVSSVIKFLINVCDASPLEVETEKEVEIARGKAYIDVVWRDKYIECIASNHGLYQKKIEELLEIKIPVIFAFSTEVNMKSISRSIIPKIKSILVFDIEKEKLFKAFDNLDEYLGYMLVGNPVKTIDINL
jgi:hypothetical protein